MNALIELIVTIFGRYSGLRFIRCSIIYFVIVWVRKKGAFKFTDINSSKLLSVASSKSSLSLGAIPALFTSRSIR